MEAIPVGAFLRELRTARRMPVSQLAERASVSRMTLSRWEAGTTQPRLPELEAVLTALGASPPQRTRAFALVAAPRAVRHLRRQPEVRQAEEAEGLGPLPAVGDLLRAMRRRQRLTLEQLAAALRVHPTTISYWERSETAIPTDRLEDLCRILQAAPEEQALLSRGPLLLAAPTRYSGNTLGDLETQLDLVEGEVDRYHCPFGDLRLLVLEARLWPLAARRPALRPLLSRAYGVHAAYLHWKGRYPEAVRYGHQALDLLDRGGQPEAYWFRAVIASLLTVSPAARRRNPRVALDVLEGWLTLAQRPADAAAILGELTLEYRRLQQPELSVRYGRRALQAALAAAEPGSNLHGAGRWFCAGALRSAGRYAEALELCPVEPLDDPIHFVMGSLERGELSLAAGDRSAAERWLRRASERVDESEETRYFAGRLARLERWLETRHRPDLTGRGDLW